jgi:hypothetical protein
MGSRLAFVQWVGNLIAAHEIAAALLVVAVAGALWYYHHGKH